MRLFSSTILLGHNAAVSSFLDTGSPACWTDEPVRGEQKRSVQRFLRSFSQAGAERNRGEFAELVSLRRHNVSPGSMNVLERVHRERASQPKPPRVYSEAGEQQAGPLSANSL